MPHGVRYYFGAEARLRRAVEDMVMTVFDGWSYEEITTPTVDYYTLFELGMGREHAHHAFRFTDTDGRLLALRPDVTSSVARAAATLFAQRERPLRFCYAAPIFRQEPPSHAEYRRESTQLGCEQIGAGGLLADMEMLAIAIEILEGLNLKGSYRITLNSVEVFNGISERLALDPASRERMRQLVDVRDGADLQKFLIPYEASAEDRAAFSRLTQLSGKREILDEARRVITNNRSVAALDALDRLWRIIEAMELTDLFEIDLGDVSGLDYYTGLVFKIYVAGAGSRVGSGGRYDNLTANFGRAEPAVGFVLNLDTLTDLPLLRAGTPLKIEQSEQAASPLIGADPAALFLEARRRRAREERVRIELAG
jgi:ATP phosphoribosyltransferase regulatory subunit